MTNKITKNKIIKVICFCIALAVMILLCFTDSNSTDSVESERYTGVLSTTGEAVTVEELKLYAKSAVLMDAASGRVLYSRNADEVMAMASTTKIMTCIVALENGNLEDMVTASAYAAGMPKVKLYLREGEQYRLKDLLYSLMLESHNDSAVAIAEHVGGSVEGFAEMMNEKAAELGCESTYFITPNGLDAVNNETGQFHSTTATELARIMAYCINESDKKEEFLEITRTPNYTFANSEGRSYSCVNHNTLLTMMEGAVSGKTGFTNKAGYCYVGAVQKDDRLFIVALLACGWPNNKSYKWSDCKTLFGYGFNTYNYKEISGEYNFEPIYVSEGIPEANDPYHKAYVNPVLGVEPEPLSVLVKESDVVEVNYLIPKVLKAPVKAGEQIGSVVYTLNGELVKQDPVITSENVYKQTAKWYMEYIFRRFAI